jgi:hypothetical protein
MKKAALLCLVLLLALALFGAGWKWGNAPKSGHGTWQQAGWAWDPGDGAQLQLLDQ